MLCGNLHNRIHGAHLPVKMHRNDRLRAGGNGRFNVFRVQIAGAAINIDKNGKSACARDAASGGEEGERCGNDLVAGADFESHEGGKQSIRPAGDSDAEAAVGQGCYPFFQLSDLRAQNADLGIQDFPNCGEDFVFERSVLRLEIEKRYFHRKAVCKALWALNSS